MGEVTNPSPINLYLLTTMTFFTDAWVTEYLESLNANSNHQWKLEKLTVCSVSREGLIISDTNGVSFLVIADEKVRIVQYSRYDGDYLNIGLDISINCATTKTPTQVGKETAKRFLSVYYDPCLAAITAYNAAKNAHNQRLETLNSLLDILGAEHEKRDSVAKYCHPSVRELVVHSQTYVKLELSLSLTQAKELLSLIAANAL